MCAQTAALSKSTEDDVEESIATYLVMCLMSYIVQCFTKVDMPRGHVLFPASCILMHIYFDAHGTRMLLFAYYLTGGSV